MIYHLQWDKQLTCAQVIAKNIEKGVSTHFKHAIKISHQALLKYHFHTSCFDQDSSDMVSVSCVWLTSEGVERKQAGSASGYHVETAVKNKHTNKRSQWDEGQGWLLFDHTMSFVLTHSKKTVFKQRCHVHKTHLHQDTWPLWGRERNLVHEMGNMPKDK